MTAATRIVEIVGNQHVRIVPEMPVGIIDDIAAVGFAEMVEFRMARRRRGDFGRTVPCGPHRNFIQESRLERFREFIRIVVGRAFEPHEIPIGRFARFGAARTERHHLRADAIERRVGENLDKIAPAGTAQAERGLLADGCERPHGAIARGGILDGERFERAEKVGTRLHRLRCHVRQRVREARHRERAAVGIAPAPAHHERFPEFERVVAVFQTRHAAPRNEERRRTRQVKRRARRRVETRQRKRQIRVPDRPRKARSALKRPERRQKRKKYGNAVTHG